MASSTCASCELSPVHSHLGLPLWKSPLEVWHSRSELAEKGGQSFWIISNSRGLVCVCVCYRTQSAGRAPTDWRFDRKGEWKEGQRRSPPYLNAEGVTSVRITEQHTLILNFHPVEETPVDVGISDKPTARERRGVWVTSVGGEVNYSPRERKRERHSSTSVSQGSGASTPTTGPSHHSSYALLTPSGGSLVVSFPPSP